MVDELTPLELVSPDEVDEVEVDDVDEVEPEADVDAIVVWARGEVPGTVTALTRLSVPTAATEPKATPAVTRFTSWTARSRERILFCSSVLGSMFEEFGARVFSDTGRKLGGC